MWFQKPPLGTPLDWGNPLNDETVLALAMNEGHGDKLQDLSLNDNHGTLNNFAFPPTVASGWNPGQTGIGLNFITDDYIRCNPFVGIGSTNSVSMGALVYPTEAGRTQGVLNTATLATDDTLALRYGSGNVIQVIYWNTLDAAQVVSGVSTIKLNEWQHWMFVLNENNVKIYLNGVLDKEENKTGTLMQDTDELDIGRYADGSYFNGAIDQPRIMNRGGSAKEVKDYAINPWQVYLDE